MSTAAERLRARILAAKEARAAAPKPTDASPAKPKQLPQTVPVPSDSNLHKRSVVTLDESDPYYNFRKTIAEIEMELNDEVPNFGVRLRDLHRIMADDPNVVTVLSDEEIGVIVKGLTVNANVTIVATKKSTSSRKRTQEITVDDI